MRPIPVLIALLLLLCMPLVSEDSEAAADNLKLSVVCPTDAFEGFAITNAGFGTDLKGYTVTDGEGTVSFTASLCLGMGETIYFCKSSPPEWLEMDKVVLYGQYGVTMKGFALADSGDDIYLYCGDQLIDAFVYGNGNAVNGGWNGEPFMKIQKRHFAYRTAFNETDSAADWEIFNPGRTSFSNTEAYPADVVPFSFPDDVSPLFCALQDAELSIDISIYLISHPRVVSSLMESMRHGVCVRILVEGSPAGGATSAEIKALKTLCNNGAEVKVMKLNDGYRGYSYLHNKYAVIDSDTTIITSENWQESSFESNRGWGAVIVSSDFAAYMERVFQSDFSRQTDVLDFDSLYPTAETVSVDRYQRETCGCTYYHADVRPVISPDNSYDTMRGFILSSRERVYSEQLDVDYSWVSGVDNPIAWMETVSAHSDCRLLVDVTFDDRNDGDYKDGYGVIDSLYTSGISVKSPEFRGLSHNKGVIVDDSVWVGSVNWTDTSFRDNREVAVIIGSADVADYYASLFLGDWGEVRNTDITVDVQNRGGTFLFEANGPEGCTYSWDLDGDGMFETDGSRVMKDYSGGRHSITLRTELDGEMTTQTIEIVVEGTDDHPMIPMKYYPIIIVCAVILLINCIRWLRGRDDPDKGVQGRGFRRGL